MRVSYKKRNKTKYFISAFIAITTLAGILSLSILRGSYAELGETEQAALNSSADAVIAAMDSVTSDDLAKQSLIVEFQDTNGKSINYATLGEPSNPRKGFNIKITNKTNKIIHINKLEVYSLDNAPLTEIEKGGGWDTGADIGYETVNNSRTYQASAILANNASTYSSNINEVKKIVFTYYFDDIYDNNTRDKHLFTQTEYVAIVGRADSGDKLAKYSDIKSSSINTIINLRLSQLKSSANGMFMPENEIASSQDGSNPYGMNSNAGTLYYSTNLYVDKSQHTTFEELGTYFNQKYSAALGGLTTLNGQGLVWELANGWDGGLIPNRARMVADDILLSVNGASETGSSNNAVTENDIANAHYEISDDFTGYRINTDSDGKIKTTSQNGVIVSSDINAVSRFNGYEYPGVCRSNNCKARLFLKGTIPSAPEGSDHATVKIVLKLKEHNADTDKNISRAALIITINIYNYSSDILSNELKAEAENAYVADYISGEITQNYETAMIAAKKSFSQADTSYNPSLIGAAKQNLANQYAILSNNLYTTHNLIQLSDVLKKGDYNTSTAGTRVSYHIYSKGAAYQLPYDTNSTGYAGYASYYDDEDDHTITKYSNVATGTINSNLTAEYDYWKIDMSSYEDALAALNTEIADVNEKYTDESKDLAAAARDEIIAIAESLTRNEPTSQSSIDYLVDALNDLLVTGSSENKLVYKYKVTFKNYDGTDLATIYVAKDTVLNADSYKGETPTKPSTVDLVYSWSGWNPALGDAITEDKEYTATFASSTRKYSIELINKKTNNEESGDTYDLESFCTFEVEYGSTWSFEDCSVNNPERSSNYQYEFSFDGWSNSENGVVRSAQSPLTGASETDIITKYYAIYSKTTQKYNAIFKDGNGDTLDTVAVDYGATPVYNGATPTKARTVQYSYSWNNGWNPSLSAQTREKVYEATFDSIDNKYWVTFLDENKTTELYKTQVVYGQSPVYGGEEPTKESDVQYNYEFKGWRLLGTEDEPAKELPALACDATSDFDNACKKTYIAVYEGYEREYEITFKNWDGTILKKYGNSEGSTDPILKYGDMPVAPEDVYRPSTAQFTYTFTGWDDKITAVKGEKTYTAQYSNTLRSYIIQFKNGSSLFDVQSIEYGQTPITPLDTPQKESTAQYDFTFNRWDPEVTTVTGPQVYNAIYDEIVRKYTIKFINEDGIVLQSSEWDYGTTPVYNGETPTKASDNYHNYTFKGWDKTISTVTGEETYTATYNEEDVYYTVAFYDEDGSLLTSDDKYIYGQEINFLRIEQNDEAVNPDDHNATSFAGWATEKYGDVEVEKGSINTTRVSGNVNYYAIYNYTITFHNEDGSDIESVTYQSNDVTEFPEVSVKEGATSFAGWATTQYGDVLESTDGINVFSNADYYVIYNYTITFHNEDGSEWQAIIFQTNKDIVFPEGPEKDDAESFVGWSDEQYGNILESTEGIKAFSNDDYYAIYNYAVKFVDYDNEVISEKTDYRFGDAVIVPENPTRDADMTYTYEFTGWNPEITTVASNTTYSATYAATFIDYTVTFKDYDGRIISEKFDYHYGDTVEVPADPVREKTAQYTYVFKGWNPAVKVVEGNEEYAAEYEEITNEYEITFEDESGNVLQKSNIKYGETPVYEGETPTKETTPSFKYKFVSWNDGLEPVTGEAVYKPTFEAIPYEISFAWTKNQEYTIGQDDESVFHIDVELKFFEHIVEVDGKEIKEGIDYTSSNGSTVITLNKNFLDTLAVGKHTMDVYYDGEVIVSTTFTILEPADVPDTGLVSNIKSFVTNGFGIFSLILAAIAGTTIWAVRKSHRK